MDTLSPETAFIRHVLVSFIQDKLFLLSTLAYNYRAWSRKLVSRTPTQEDKYGNRNTSNRFQSKSNQQSNPIPVYTITDSEPADQCGLPAHISPKCYRFSHVVRALCALNTGQPRQPHRHYRHGRLEKRCHRPTPSPGSGAYSSQVQAAGLFGNFLYSYRGTIP